MANGEGATKREPYDDANVNTYATTQFSLVEEMAVQKFEDPTDRTLLSYLYILRENRFGMVSITANGLAERLGDKEENIVQQLDALQKTGHVYRDKFFIILTGWRWYMGVDNAKRDIEGRMYVTKGMAKTILSIWNRLSQDGQRKCLESCGKSSKADLVEIIERHDNRGGHNRKDDEEQSESKAGAKPEQSESKAGANNKNKNKNKSKSKNEEEKEEEDEEVEGETASSSSLLSQQEEETALSTQEGEGANSDPVIVDAVPFDLMADAFYRRWGHKPLARSDSKWKPFTRFIEGVLKKLGCKKEDMHRADERFANIKYGAVADTYHDLLVRHCQDMADPSPYFGNLLSPRFDAWLQGNVDKETFVISLARKGYSKYLLNPPPLAERPL